MVIQAFFYLLFDVEFMALVPVDFLSDPGIFASKRFLSVCLLRLLPLQV
jgi:hypothetical protein